MFVLVDTYAVLIELCQVADRFGVVVVHSKTVDKSKGFRQVLLEYLSFEQFPCKHELGIFRFGRTADKQQLCRLCNGIVLFELADM